MSTSLKRKVEKRGVMERGDDIVRGRTNKSKKHMDEEERRTGRKGKIQIKV